MRNVTAAP
ncbi:hypothetical protein LEMLEM_LOCUS4188 [Lemmus lemmus]